MTRQQRFAKEALAKVLAVVKTDKEKKFHTHCMKTPSLIHQAGALQAVAFWNRDKDAKASYLPALATVYGKGVDKEGVTGKTLLDSLTGTTDLAGYMALSRDLAEAALWLRRFAQAELKSEEGAG